MSKYNNVNPDHYKVAGRERSGNAVAKAYTPFLDKYLSAYKHTLLDASGECVGLPVRR